MEGRSKRNDTAILRPCYVVSCRCVALAASSDDFMPVETIQTAAAWQWLQHNELASTNATRDTRYAINKALTTFLLWLFPYLGSIFYYPVWCFFPLYSCLFGLHLSTFFCPDLLNALYFCHPSQHSHLCSFR